MLYLGNFTRILMIIVGVLFVISIVYSISHQTLLTDKRAYRKYDLHYFASSNNHRTIMRKKRSNLNSVIEPFFHRKRHMSRPMNTIVLNKISKSTSSNHQDSENYNSLGDLQKLFAITKNKSRSDNLIGLTKLEKPSSSTTDIHVLGKQDKSKFDKASSIASREYLRTMPVSLATKNSGKPLLVINRVNDIFTDKYLKHDAKNQINEINQVDVDNGIGANTGQKKINLDVDLTIKTPSGNIDTDTAKDDDYLSSVKLIRTKRYGDANHEPQHMKVHVKSHEHKGKSDVKDRKDSETTEKLFQSSKALEILQDLQNLVGKIVTKIGEVQGSMQTATKLKRYFRGRSSLMKSSKSVYQVTRHKQCKRKEK